MSAGVKPREPSQTDEPATVPAFLPGGDRQPYRASPWDRWDWLAPQVSSLAPLLQGMELDVSRAPAGETYCTIDTSFTVNVKELVYPGGPNDVREVDGKWAYVFRGGKLVVEAKATRPGTWDGWTLEGGKRVPWRANRGIQIDPGPSGGRHTYAYFLSPVRLTPKAIDYLSKREHSVATVESACDAFGKVVCAPDPLSWAAAAHARYYQPRLRTLQWWQYDPDVVAYAFVAGVLKAWIDAGDRAGIRNELRTQPGDWIVKRKAGIDAALRKADEAMAYVAHCVDSPEYYAVEQSALERGGEDLELAGVALAAASQDLFATEPGKKLGQHLCSADRLPGRLLFNDHGPALEAEWFKRHRAGALGLLGLFQDLVPARIQLLEAKSARIKGADTQRDRIRRYLKNLGVETTLSDPARTISTNLGKDKKIGAGLKRGSKAWRKVQTEWRRLVLVKEVKHGFPTPQEVKAKDLAKRFAPFEAGLKRISATVGSAIELANLVLDYTAYKNATAAERGAKAWSVVGACADLSAHGLGVSEKFLAEFMGMRVVKGAAGLAGCIGGVIDMLEYEEQLVESLGEYDYGKVVGRGMQVAGAAAGAAGGAMILAGAIYGTALGPAGVIVGVIGGVLVAGGFVVATWLSHNANETFANRCFLGKNGGKEGKRVGWAEEVLPCSRPEQEARILLGLLSQFQLSGRANLGDWWLDIHPGYVEPDWKFDVDVVLTWGKDTERDKGVRKRNERRYKIEVPLHDEAAPRQVAGSQLKPEHQVFRDGEGRVESIAVNLEERVRPANEFRQFQGVVATVRLLRDGGDQWVPYKKQHSVKVVLPGTETVSSADSDSWVVTSNVSAK